MKILSLIVLFMFFTFKIYGHGTIIVQGVEHEEGKIDVKIYKNKDVRTNHFNSEAGREK